MECPHCNSELEYHNYFGRLFSHQDGQVLGDIYKCINESCENFEGFYYTYRNRPDDLHEGYLC
jgi:primosomal protein N'